MAISPTAHNKRRWLVDESLEVSQPQILLKSRHHKICSTWLSRKSAYFWAGLFLYEIQFARLEEINITKATLKQELH